MSRHFGFVAIALGLFVASSGQVKSQTLDNALEGFSAFGVSLAAPLGDDSARCGIREDDLISAVSFPIAASRIRLDQGAETRFWILINTMRSETTCWVDFRVWVAEGVYARLSTGVTKFVEAFLWQEEGIMTGSTRDTGPRLRDVIENIAKEFVVDWTLDQSASD